MLHIPHGTAYIRVLICTRTGWRHGPNLRETIRSPASPRLGSGFYPRPVLAFGYCHCLCLWVCVCVCINQELVHTITQCPFKLGSPNLDQRCKTPWFRSLMFLGMIDLDLQGKIKLESQILPHFELVHTITHQPFNLESPNLDWK